MHKGLSDHYGYFGHITILAIVGIWPSAIDAIVDNTFWNGCLKKRLDLRNTAPGSNFAKKFNRKFFLLYKFWKSDVYFGKKYGVWGTLKHSCRCLNNFVGVSCMVIEWVGFWSKIQFKYLCFFNDPSPYSFVYFSWQDNLLVCII